MAAPPQVPTVPNTPLFNGYREDESTHGNARLPSGPCNYINVNSGGNAPKCGCRRFTEKPVDLYGSGQRRPGLCFCEHHSCFHDHDSVDAPRVVVDLPAAGGILLTPKPSMYRQSPAQQDHEMQDVQPEVGRPMKSDSLPDTLQWSRFVKSGSSLGSFPAIPSQCLLPSDDGSRASSSQPGSMRPFGGLGLNTLSRIPTANTIGLKGQVLAINERRMQLYEDSNGKQYLQSLTELATPSLQSSQDQNAGIPVGNSIPKVQDKLQRISEERSQGLGPNEDHSRTLSDQNVHASVVRHEEELQNHEQRLDCLENASFSHPAIDDLHDTTGELDTRIGDLENRFDDLEKTRLAQIDAGSFAGRQQLEGSIDSRMSNTSSALIAAAMDRIDYGRIEALEAKVNELQTSAAPSHACPWEFEVVFLPFGSRMHGIWSSQHPISQRSRMNSTGGDDTQTQFMSMAAAQASLATHDENVSWEWLAKSSGNEQAAWLTPRVCGLRSRIGERLRSRGLVKLIQITGPGARDVDAAILAAFGNLPNLLSEDPYSDHDRTRQPIPISLSSYLGLKKFWVPLRKVHKDDNLRFLNTSEMITPALWTAHFLSSGIAARIHGTRRLYVTQSDSYIQHLRGESAEWSWQKLRQLPRVYPDALSMDHTPEADAHEPCWEFDEFLDPPESIHSSFASHSVLSIRTNSHEQGAEPTSPSDHFSSLAASAIASTTPTSLAPPPAHRVSPLKERHPFRPIHTRTLSMPTLVPINSSPAMPKRRITSFEPEHDHESQSSPIHTVSAAFKRRRTRSPSRPRDTPRYSAGPPSPYTFVDDIVERNKRGTTPFAYATPHSNAPYIEASRHLQNDDDEDGSATDEVELDENEGYDRHALSDYDSEEASDAGHQPDDDVWEGVQEDESRTALVGKTVGLRQNEDADEGMASDASSGPSEYPSRQPEGLYSETKAGFRIHVDEEVEDAQ